MSASVNLSLHHKVQKFSSGTGSPGWSPKKGCKTVVVWYETQSDNKVRLYQVVPAIDLADCGFRAFASIYNKNSVR